MLRVHRAVLHIVLLCVLPERWQPEQQQGKYEAIHGRDLLARLSGFFGGVSTSEWSSIAVLP
jgi:hypothetical protein